MINMMTRLEHLMQFYFNFIILKKRVLTISFKISDRKYLVVSSSKILGMKTFFSNCENRSVTPA